MATQQVICERLPLAVYRELAAHLSQVMGVSADLVWRSAAEGVSGAEVPFNYAQSQIAALQIHLSQPADAQAEAQIQAQIQAILTYYQIHYGERYGPWIWQELPQG